MAIEAWFMDETSGEDQRSPRHCNPKEFVSLDYLAELGVLYWRLNPANYESDEELKKIREDRGYNYMDLLDICPEKVADFKEKLKNFYTEHIHADEEIRYCLEGSAYFKCVLLALKPTLVVFPLQKMYFNKFKKPENEEVKEESGRGKQSIDLGNGSEVIYIQRFIGFEKSWEFFDYLNKHIPWIRPTIRVFGRQCLQPRDTCYVASPGLPELVYSGYKPHAYSWDDFPPIKDLLDMVHETLPGSKFNSLLLNKYKGGNDNVGWHADDEKLYGPTPEIASVSFGCEREFLLKKRPMKSSQERRLDDEPTSKRLKKSSQFDQHSFILKHGSLLVMKGYTQRDWLHSVPKRAKAEATRINLTFRHVVV